ncbi:hypothetical protein CHU98_g6319 [Xylaria longipes]|nr:hypothetical protein CHU98_g6319 [Xylaria longipes]
MPTEAGHRLYVKRSKHTTHPNRSLVKIEGVDTTEAAKYVHVHIRPTGDWLVDTHSFYLGKKIAFVHKAPKETRGTHTRVIWGKVVRPHGNSGAVQARFSVPLPTKSFGASLRVLLYPSSI